MIKKDRITTFNALKGIGAVGILFSHMAYLKDATNPFWKNFYTYFMANGAICATLFVLCSGFFLSYAWKDQSFSKYVIGKLKRLYPLAFLVFLAALATDVLLSGNAVANEGVPVGTGQWYFNIVANLFLFKAFIPVESVFYSFHGPSWYISFLFVFYLIAYAFMKGLHGENRAKWLRAMKIIAVTAYAAELVICILVRVNGWSSLWLCYVNPWFRIFGEGFVGILLCEEMDKWQGKLKNATLWEIIAAALFIGSFLIRNFHLKIFSAWFQVIPMGMLLIAFRSGTGVLSKGLNSRGMQFLGTISFELYMTHAFVYEGLPVAVGFASKSVQSWLIAHAGTRFIITFILCIIVAWLVHLLMKWINKKIIYRKRA